ncbi:VOC family protein [Haloferacaceae archaeon DSL9]
MAGIVFFATERHDAVVDFYTGTVGADIRLEQPDCTILKYDNFLFGFCDRDHTDADGILTFVSETRAQVDAMYGRVGDAATERPHENERYRIYQFFAEDPDGRTAEFQAFLGDVDL